MNIAIDPHSGFCFGVVYAIEVAERELRTNGSLYCLGDIVHNNMEVNRLKEMGLIIIEREKLASLHDCSVLIRAHGEPPETYRMALKNNIRLIDASCPIVLNLQNEVRRGFVDASGRDGQIVIYGKEGHAEVNGLIGQTGGKAIVVSDDKDLGKIDFSRPVRLFAQTTKSIEGFKRIVEQITERMQQASPGRSPDFHYHDTICRQVSNRSAQLMEFAGKFEVIIFVSGKKSSNGMVLYEVCRNKNPRTYLVSSPADLRKDWFENVKEAGICGATSTPMWLMEEVGNAIRNMNP